MPLAYMFFGKARGQKRRPRPLVVVSVNFSPELVMDVQLGQRGVNGAALALQVERDQPVHPRLCSAEPVRELQRGAGPGFPTKPPHPRSK